MFTLARYVVRHKVGATAMVALGVVFMMPDKESGQEQLGDRWSAPAKVQVAQVEQAGSFHRIMDGPANTFDD